MGSPIGPHDPMASKGRDDDDDHHRSDDRTASYFPHVHRSKYDLNSKIMLTAIISLSVVVLLVIALHVYARYVLRRQARRRRAALQHLGLSVSRARSAEQPAPPAKRGLDPSLIASLPLLPFEPPTAATTTTDPPSSQCPECAVCLGALEAGEMVRLLPACRHTFHAVCIDTWLAAQSTCPVCRAEVDPTPPRRPVLLPEPREAPTAPPLSSSAASAPSSSSSSCMELETTSSSSEQAVVSNKAALSNNTSSNGNGGSNRLSLSFRRMLSRDQRSSSRIIQPSFGQLDQDVIEDLERQ